MNEKRIIIKLLQISSESSDALSKANESMNAVTELNGRLNTLKRKFLKNRLSASEITEEVETVAKDANKTVAEVDLLCFIKCLQTLISHFLSIVIFIAGRKIKSSV